MQLIDKEENYFSCCDWNCVDH